MRQEDSGNLELPYKMAFQGAEIPVIQALYCEKLSRLALEGESNTMPVYQTGIAEWIDYKLPRSKRRVEKSLLLRDPLQLAEDLDEFAAHTDDVIVDLGTESDEPSFQNYNIVIRRDLGDRALELAGVIRQSNIENIDSGLSKLLGSDKSSDAGQPLAE